ncbi:hypothetical protein BPC006_I2651 [Burkholderia pseudomallei BPC006]|nr:hypothetical protein BPC006_I2651 [Burkholderia pseudomallei BPC006]
MRRFARPVFETSGHNARRFRLHQAKRVLKRNGFGRGDPRQRPYRRRTQRTSIIENHELLVVA